MIEPYKAYRIFAEVALKLEIELGLEITNHRTRKVRSDVVKQICTPQLSHFFH